MLIKIQGTTYPVKSAAELSLLDLLTLERETRDLGRPLTMSVIAGMENSVQAAIREADGSEAKRKARTEHPESAWLLAVTLWASRKAAGDHVTFEEAISFPLSALEFVAEAGDADDADVDPPQPRPASVPGGKHPAKRSATKTSSPRSTAV